MQWAFLDDPPVRAFAHRGGNVKAPENTIAAFEHAVSLGYRYLETDVHCSKDGVLVAFHDAGLERFAGQDHQIADMTWDDLQAIEVTSKWDGSVHRIPRMEDLVRAFPQARFNIDPKSDASVPPLIRMIRELDVLHRVCVGSFDDDRTEAARTELGPELCTSVGPKGLMKTLLPGMPAPGGFAVAAVPQRIGPVPMNQRLIGRLKEAGLAVHVWTVNEEADIERFIRLGVDGIMTDEVEVLMKVLS